VNKKMELRRSEEKKERKLRKEKERLKIIK